MAADAANGFEPGQTAPRPAPVPTMKSLRFMSPPLLILALSVRPYVRSSGDQSFVSQHDPILRVKAPSAGCAWLCESSSNLPCLAGPLPDSSCALESGAPPATCDSSRAVRAEGSPGRWLSRSRIPVRPGERSPETCSLGPGLRCLQTRALHVPHGSRAEVRAFPACRSRYRHREEKAFDARW